MTPLCSVYPNEWSQWINRNFRGGHSLMKTIDRVRPHKREVHWICMNDISERIWLISNSKPSSQPCEDQRFPGSSASIHIQMTFRFESLVQKLLQPQTFSDLLIGHPNHITLSPLFCSLHFTLDGGYLCIGLSSVLEFLILRTSLFYSLCHLPYERRQLFLKWDNKGMNEGTALFVCLLFGLELIQDRQILLLWASKKGYQYWISRVLLTEGL